MEPHFHRRHPKISFLFLNPKGHGSNPLQTEDMWILNYISSNTRFKSQKHFPKTYPTPYLPQSPTHGELKINSHI